MLPKTTELNSRRVLLKALFVLLVLAAFYVSLHGRVNAPTSLSQAVPFVRRDYPDLSNEKFVVEVDDHPSLGDILIDEKGRTLYYYTKDEAGISKCDDVCSDIWEKATTGVDVVTGPGKLKSKLGLTNEGKQLLYENKPLYYYKEDVNAGDVYGHGLDDSWYAVQIEDPY